MSQHHGARATRGGNHTQAAMASVIAEFEFPTSPLDCVGFGHIRFEASRLMGEYSTTLLTEHLSNWQPSVTYNGTILTNTG